ncbi:VanW family protein [Timonella sp. A28]|uniref:VanW family protein n=1 Tax=Timonella sp. A28 TaxID=3442640 RepID=UPI003EB848CD
MANGQGRKSEDLPVDKQKTDVEETLEEHDTEHDAAVNDDEDSHEEPSAPEEDELDVDTRAHATVQQEESSDVDEPVAEEVAEEAASEEDSAEEPVVEEPVTRDPEESTAPDVTASADEPLLDDSTHETSAPEENDSTETDDSEPAVEEPAVEEPAVEEPAVEELVVEEPAVEEPVQEETKRVSPAPIPILTTPPENPLAPIEPSEVEKPDEREPESVIEEDSAPATTAHPIVDAAALSHGTTEQPQPDVQPKADAAPKTASEPVTEQPPTIAPRSFLPEQSVSQHVVGTAHKESKKDSNASLDDFENEEKTKFNWSRGFIGITAGVVVLVGGYLAAQWAFADSIAKGTTVAGVDVGGLNEADAATLLDERLSHQLDAKVQLSSGELKTSIVPREAGISLDAAQTVDGLTGFTLSPAYFWDHIAGGGELEPVLTVDNTAFKTTIEAAVSSLHVEPVNGTVAFVDGAAVATPAEDGTSVDYADAQKNIVDNLFTSVRPIPLTTMSVAPEMTQELTDTYLQEAKKIASASVTVQVGDQSAELLPDTFTKDISVSTEGNTMSFDFDGEKLAQDVVKRTDNLLTESKDAKFVFVEGKPVIKPGKAGTKIDAEALSRDFAQAAKGDNRTTEAHLVEVDPKDSNEALEALGIKEKVASFSTPLTSEYYRTENLRLAAKRVTGTLVKPGEEFNLIKAIGPVTTANGYHAAGVIVNGIHKDGVGGGLSQMSTTSYNAGFFAGMTDIAHRPHSVWFTRYPEGRESTLFEGSIDMIWRNDSDTGILLRSYISGGKLTVEAWGTKTYDVKTTTSPRRNIVRATTNTSTASDCIPYRQGHDGFTVTVTRKVTEIATSKTVIDEANTWTYKPDHGVVCEKPKSEKDDKDN